MKINFYGGAKTVTGANYLIEIGGKRILVDCGLFQGSKYAENLNYQKFLYDPAQIDAVLITHGHTDHIGRLPKLYKDGFRGKIYLTEPTDSLVKKSLPNNLDLLKDEALEEGIEPLFNESDLSETLKLFKPVPYYQEVRISDVVKVEFYNAGHILGSAIIKVSDGDKNIYFTGDIGNPPTPLLPYPDFIEDADYLVVESAYGDRIHEDRSRRKDMLENVIEDTVTKGGVLMIPSFAIERTQELLYELNELVENKRIPSVPIFIDSPLAIKMTEVYKRFSHYFNEATMNIIQSGDDIFDFSNLKFTNTVAESKAINNIEPPKIIIAGSGMSTGGRILHHEKLYLSDPKNTILFIGYQVEGCIGRRILDGEKEVKIHGQQIDVRCNIEAIGGYSAHADQNQLVNWIKKANSQKKLKKVFVVQGEEKAAVSLATRIKDELVIDAQIPGTGDQFEL